MPGTFPKPIPVAVPQVLQPNRQSVGNGRNVPTPGFVRRGPALAREQTNRQGNKIQDAARIAGIQANTLPIGAGNLIQGVSFVAGQTVTLQHGLGRAWNGFIVLNRLLVPSAPRGTATLSSGSVVVTPTHNLVPNAGTLAIAVAYNTISGTPGTLSVPNASRTATTFTIQSSSATDNSTVDWLVSPPWPGDFAGVPQGPGNTTQGPLDATSIVITAPYTCTADVWVF